MDVTFPAAIRLHGLKFEDFPGHRRIDGRSRKDAIGKTLVFMQTIWFLANVLGRLGQGLGLSLLEVHTASIAVYGLISLLASFARPQGISEAFEIDVPISTTALTAAQKDTSAVRPATPTPSPTSQPMSVHTTSTEPRSTPTKRSRRQVLLEAS
ncbi:hypothetical protein B0T24DRAFT_618588 [Lasiosphaeria ovina]|uniref:Uncharacterized protein n=1 Tax=Lasiosphaeria ovina TaxID=92902 RepID=A0AAE0KGM1_9PEZI|nr:hypothetical protein B0T24DRAFT_618588 [Lasiosphaeria ovina]